MTTHEIRLPAGFPLSETQVERKAIISEITGATQRALSAPEIRQRPATIVRCAVEQCLQRIGTIECSPELVNKLDVADREFIFYQIRKISLNNILNFEANCIFDNCSLSKGAKKITARIDMDDFDVYELPDPGDKRCKYEIVKTDSGIFPYRKIWSALNPDLGISFKMKYDNVEQDEKRQESGNSTENMQRLMADLLYEWKENGTINNGPFKLSFWDTKSESVIEWTQQELISNLPGINFNIEIKCPSCGGTNPFRIEHTDFFSRKVARGGSGLIQTKLSGL